MGSGMTCEEKSRLIRDHHEAALAYSKAARTFKNLTELLPSDQLEQSRTAVESARIKSEQARLAVASHTVEHGC